MTYPSLRDIPMNSGGHLTYLTFLYFPFLREYVTPPFHAGLLGPDIFSLAERLDSSVHPCRPFDAISLSRSASLFPRHFGEQDGGLFPILLHGGRLNFLRQIGHTSISLMFGGTFPLLERLIEAAEHPREQVLFRSACSFVKQGKIVEQIEQTFQNGYERLALP